MDYIYSHVPSTVKLGLQGAKELFGLRHAQPEDGVPEVWLIMGFQA